MHHRDCSVSVFVFLHEKQSERFTHDHAAAKNHDVRAVNVDLAFDQQTLHAERRARHKAARIVEHELCNVFRVKAVHVLARIERAHDCCFIDVLGWRRLNENAMNSGIAIKFFDAREKLCLCDRRRQLQLYRVQAKLAAHFVFRTNIGARSWIVSHENDGETGGNAFRF